MSILSGFDMIALGIVCLSILISLARGFVKETLALLGWLVSFYLAYTYFQIGAAYLKPYIQNESARQSLSFIIIFISSVCLTAFITYWMCKIIKFSGMQSLDRLFGFLFGAARGMLIVYLIIALCSALGLTRYTWWRQSLLVRYLIPEVKWLQKELPQLRNIHEINKFL